MINVSISFVDGGLQELSKNNAFGERLLQLQNRGYEGKQLIHALLTDDWGPPPTVITIKGKLNSGKRIDISIPYR